MKLLEFARLNSVYILAGHGVADRIDVQSAEQQASEDQIIIPLGVDFRFPLSLPSARYPFQGRAKKFS